MATIALEDLTHALTVDEIKSSIYRTLELTGVATTNWKPGAVVRTIIAAIAIVLAGLSSLAALSARAGFVSLSTGLWKTLAARYERNVERQEDTFAAGEGLLSNSSGNTYALDPGDLTVSVSLTGKTYTNTTAVTLNPGDVDIPSAFEAVEAGSASTAFVGEVDSVESALLGVTVTNAVAWIGLDAESDEALQAKCDEKLGALSPNGPSDAYAHFARSAARSDGTAIGVTRVRVVPDGDLGVDVYCATASGGVDGLQDDPTTDLGAIHELLQRNVVPIPITERTHSATRTPIDVSYSVWLYNNKGVSPLQIAQGIATALAQLLAAKPIGGDVVQPDPGKIFADDIRAAIMRATSPDGLPLGIFRVTLASPGGDVTLSGNDAPVIGAITVGALTQVAVPQGSL